MYYFLCEIRNYIAWLRDGGGSAKFIFKVLLRKEKNDLNGGKDSRNYATKRVINVSKNML